MRWGPIVFLGALSLIPAGWLTYLVLAGRGDFWLRLVLAGVFVLLALAAGVPILRASGVSRARARLRIRNWLEVDTEFEGPKEPDDGQSR